MGRHSEDLGGQYGPPSRPLADGEVYGPAREVALATAYDRRRRAPTPDRVAHATWRALFIEMALRLEQTSALHALEIPLRDNIHLQSARTNLRRYFERAFGQGYVRLISRYNPPACMWHGAKTGISRAGWTCPPQRRRKKKVLRLGQLIVLRCELVEGFDGAPIPANTLGIVVGELRGTPQVALEGHGIRLVPEHIIEPTVAHPDEFVGIIAALIEANETLAKRLARATQRRPLEFGRS